MDFIAPSRHRVPACLVVAQGLLCRSVISPPRLCADMRGHTNASTLAGPPVAPTCLGAPTMTVAPEGGTRARFASNSMPYLPAPRIATCATNFCGGCRVQAERVDAHTANIALADEKARRRLAESWRVHRAFCVAIQKPIGARHTRIPARVHRHERTGGYAAVSLLPLQEIVD